MAYLTGTERVYLFVTEEESPTSVQASEHSVEQGEDLTDHIRPNADEVTLSGVISGANHKNIISLIAGWQRSGQAVRYAGRATLSQAMIQDFSQTWSPAIKNGCSFSMTLKKVRTAKPAYVIPLTEAVTKVTETIKAVANAGTQSVEQNNKDDCFHPVKAGDSVWSLVNGAYKKYGKTCEQIMAMNPDAFSRKGDLTSLKTGARLRMDDHPDWSTI